MEVGEDLLAQIPFLRRLIQPLAAVGGSSNEAHLINRAGMSDLRPIAEHHSVRFGRVVAEAYPAEVPGPIHRLRKGSSLTTDLPSILSSTRKDSGAAQRRSGVVPASSSGRHPTHCRRSLRFHDGFRVNFHPAHVVLSGSFPFDLNSGHRREDLEGAGVAFPLFPDLATDEVFPASAGICHRVCRREATSSSLCSRA